MENKKETKKVENVEEVKNKYKKTRNIFIIILVVLAVFVIVDIIHDTYVLNKIFEKNVEIDYGTNYKVTTQTNGSITEIYRKDDRIKFSAGIMGKKDRNIIVWDGEKAYLVVTKDKVYYEMSENNIPQKPNTKGVTFFPSIMIEKENVDTLFEALKTRLTFNIRVSTEKLEGNKAYALKVGYDDIKLWFSIDDYSFIREVNYGNVTSMKAEKDVVTDADVMLPWEQDYKKMEM